MCTSVRTLQNNHENSHFRFRTLTMQMCCWIVDLNYLTLVGGWVGQWVGLGQMTNN